MNDQVTPTGSLLVSKIMMVCTVFKGVCLSHIYHILQKMTEVYPSPRYPPTLLIYPFKIAMADYGPFPAVGRNRNRLNTDGGDPYKMVPQKKWLGNPKTPKTYQFPGRKKYFPLPYGNDQDSNGGLRLNTNIARPFYEYRIMVFHYNNK